MENTTRITATLPFSATFSPDPDIADGERADFMRHAQTVIVETGLPGIDDASPDDVAIIMHAFDIEGGDLNERGYTMTVRDRMCAERLLAAGLLDHTAWDIVQRWGAAHPMKPRES